MKRKAELTLTIIIGIILGSIIAWFLFQYAVPGLLSIFPGGQSSTEAFQELSAKLIELEDGERIQHTYFITEDNTLIAFSKGQATTEDTTKFLPTGDTYIRPDDNPSCTIEQTCLCLCETDVGPNACKTFNAECIPLIGIERIEGIVVDDNGRDIRKSATELIIQGRSRVLLSISKEDNVLSIRTPERPQT